MLWSEKLLLTLPAAFPAAARPGTARWGTAAGAGTCAGSVPRARTPAPPGRACSEPWAVAMPCSSSAHLQTAASCQGMLLPPWGHRTGEPRVASDLCPVLPAPGGADAAATGSLRAVGRAESRWCAPGRAGGFGRLLSRTSNPHSRTRASTREVSIRRQAAKCPRGACCTEGASTAEPRALPRGWALNGPDPAQQLSAPGRASGLPTQKPNQGMEHRARQHPPSPCCSWPGGQNSCCGRW